MPSTPDAKMGSRISAWRLQGKPIDAGEDVQSRRLGAGFRRGEGGRRRAGLGRDGPLPAGAEDGRAGCPNVPALAGVAGNPGWLEMGQGPNGTYLSFKYLN